MPQNFTDLMLRKLAHDGSRRVEYWDGRIPGFGLRVSPSGTKTFILMYRHRGRPRRLTIGRYPILSLADARTRASEALRQVSLGNDPALIQEQANDPSFRFDAVVGRYVERHCKVHNKPSTARETERLLRKHFVAAWGKRDIRDITQAHVSEILEALIAAGKPSEANHALGVIKTFFSWCEDRDLLTVSPCAKIRKPAKHGSRSRVLSGDELAAVWKAAEAEAYPFGRMTQLLILTAQRRGEVTQMRDDQIDLEAATWTIPADLAKNGRAHVLPLPDTAAEILRGLPRFESPYLFPAKGNPENVISGFTRAKARLDEVSGVAGWTLHDLRRTAATHTARLGVAPHVIERILNHVSGTFAGVTGVYNRFQYLDEMREALALWDDHLHKLIRKSR